MHIKIYTHTHSVNMHAQIHIKTHTPHYKKNESILANKRINLSADNTINSDIYETDVYYMHTHT